VPQSGFLGTAAPWTADVTSFALSHHRKVRADGFGGFTKTLAALVLRGRRGTRNGEKGES
jgi:hypothetical protein